MKNPLNDNDVNGNTMAWMADSDRTRADDGDAPGFYCEECDEYYTEEEFNVRHDVCYRCWFKVDKNLA